jgi:hypothetical protein
MRVRLAGYVEDTRYLKKYPNSDPQALEIKELRDDLEVKVRGRLKQTLKLSYEVGDRTRLNQDTDMWRPLWPQQ